MNEPRYSEAFVIPAGTPVHSMRTGRWHVSTRKQTVYPFSIAKFDDWTIVTWPGQSGYWRRVAIDDGAFVARWPGEEVPTWDELARLGG
jgi:hypothetical protein